MYPPYLFAEISYFRMGMGGGTAGVVPSHLAVGKEVSQGVQRIGQKKKLKRMQYFTPIDKK